MSLTEQVVFPSASHLSLVWPDSENHSSSDQPSPQLESRQKCPISQLALCSSGYHNASPSPKKCLLQKSLLNNQTGTCGFFHPVARILDRRRINTLPGTTDALCFFAIFMQQILCAVKSKNYYPDEKNNCLSGPRQSEKGPC